MEKDRWMDGTRIRGDTPLHGRLSTGIVSYTLLHGHSISIVCVFVMRLGYQRSQNQSAKENGGGVGWRRRGWNARRGWEA